MIEQVLPYELDAAERAREAPMLDQVEEWSCINSGSRNMPGLAEMARVLADSFSILPGELDFVEPTSATSVDARGIPFDLPLSHNLLLTVRPSAPVQLLLTGHMDTVFEADDAFQTCRIIAPGVINGPGVADMKGGISAMLSALAAFEGVPGRERIGYQVLLNADEEIGSPGSAPLLRQCAAGKRAALTYEPAALPDGTLAGARPGSGNFSFVVRGRSAHAGRNPQDGRNALVAAADLATGLARLSRQDLSINCSRIDGGSPNNVVPDLAVLRVNVRPRFAADERQARLDFERLLAEVASSHDVSIELHGAFGRPPKTLDAETLDLLRLVHRCGRFLGLEIGWRDTGGVCDGNNISACGIPVIDTMGVRGGSIHSTDEYLIVESLGERAALSTLLLCTLLRS